VVDISALNNILEIDEVPKTAVVEPNVPMDKLVQATLARGMVPPVVMEFPGITVGGGFAGSAGESSSFRYGYFDHAIRAVELVLGTGDIVRASATEHPDLFRGAAGTAGTLGIVTNLPRAQSDSGTTFCEVGVSQIHHRYRHPHRRPPSN
jgi:FAD/FMN-containing dehydrogenase